MGIKMHIAKYEGKEIKLNEYKEEMRNKLTCIYCGTPIIHVNEFIKQLGGCDVHVSAYFRLKSSKNFPHQDYCNYITENRIKNIYADCNDNEIMTKRDEKYIVRLHIITDTLEIQKVDDNSTKKDNYKKRSTLQYLKSGDKPAYISTIRSIMKLRDEVENDSDLKESLCLNFYNMKTKRYDDIPWKHFFIEYDRDTYISAYNYIQKRVYHPMCFYGKVKTIDEPTENFQWYKIKFYSIKAKENQYVSFEVLFKNGSIYNTYKNIAEKEIIVYCAEHYAKENNNSKSKNDGQAETTYFNISSKIYGGNQILLLNR
ncbi:hypothetical protein [Clostridium beijerinckii]|uniref:hypothetical protein n=1 Tax=Clostridium beijerinckii TaxID=1520 RepID=UPI001360C0F3|nr:hypothetical protein [Clostridium beijerinckii]MZK50965.1 hypothetical protein [Clostridium beijerinckii]MZK59167.1 hypothetical protein [Clostridium beijerinckii]MZK69286.1 hypothetical protein [Clostridium beijerinckii]MZK74659.1 hypothetical protein [Clostridium beijerinckii]MZK84378.1 hypothetical protein [Clostridium beijerinckii]